MTKKQIIKGKQRCDLPILKFYTKKGKYKTMLIKADFEKLNLHGKNFVKLAYDPETKKLEILFTYEKQLNSYRLNDKRIISKQISANAILKQIDIDVTGKTFALKYTAKDTLEADLNKGME